MRARGAATRPPDVQKFAPPRDPGNKPAEGAFAGKIGVKMAQKPCQSGLFPHFY